MQVTANISAGPAGNSNGAVLQAVPYPNPNPSSLRIRLYKDADQVCVRLYRPDATVFGERCAGPFAAGWSTIELPEGWADAAPGRYYYSVSGGGQFDADQAGCLMRLR